MILRQVGFKEFYDHLGRRYTVTRVVEVTTGGYTFVVNDYYNYANVKVGERHTTMNPRYSAHDGMLENFYIKESD